LILAKRPRSDTVRQHGQPPLGSEQNINVDSLMLKKKNPHLLGMFLVRKKIIVFWLDLDILKIVFFQFWL
jgi:hypothetical protein